MIRVVAGSHQAYDPLHVPDWDESNIQQSLQDVAMSRTLA